MRERGVCDVLHRKWTVRTVRQRKDCRRQRWIVKVKEKGEKKRKRMDDRAEWVRIYSRVRLHADQIGARRSKQGNILLCRVHWWSVWEDSVLWLWDWVFACACVCVLLTGVDAGSLSR